MARTELEQLVYQMSADIRQLERSNQRALGNVDKSANQMQRRYDRLAKEMGQDFGRISAVAGVAFGAIVAYSTRAASDAEETANAFKVAFGDLEGQANAFAKSYSKAVGRALDETQANMARTQLVLTGVGVAAEQALSMTEAIQRRAIDIGSLFNVSDADAFRAVMSGISGEAEPMKRFGVALNEAAVKAELLRLGFKGNAEQAPEAAKAIARLNIIAAQTSKADGDAIRTKDGLANSTKAAQGAFRDLSVELGRTFLPFATKTAKAATELLGEFNQMPDSVKLAGLAFLGLVASTGPIAAVIAALGRLISYAGAAKRALIAVGGGSAAAGAGGAAGAAAAMRGGGVLAAGAAVLSLGGDAPRGDAKAKAQRELNTLLAQEQQYRLRQQDLPKDSEESKKLDRWIATVQKNIERRNKILFSTDKKKDEDPQAAADAAAAAAIAGLQNGFGLADNLKSPVGGSKGKTAASLAAAAKKETDELDRYNTELVNLHDQELQARQDQNLSIHARAQLELDRLDAEQKAYEADINHGAQVGAERIPALIAAKKAVTEAERAAVIAQRDADLQDQKLAQDRELADLNIQILQIHGATADSLLERLEVEERILAIRQQQEREALDDYLKKNPNVTNGAEQSRALDELQAAARGDLRRVAGEELKGGILDAFEAAKGGLSGLAEFFGDRLRDKLKDRLADLAADFLLGAAKSQSGTVFGTIAKFATTIFGGRETGGPARKGVPINVGENGRELFVPSSDGHIISNSRLRKMGAAATGTSAAGGGDVYLAVTVNADGAIPREEIMQMVQTGSLQAVQAARTLTRADSARAGQQRLGRR